MKNHFAALVLLGALTYDPVTDSAQAVQLKQQVYEKLYFQLSNKISNRAKTLTKQHLQNTNQVKSHDWDDALRDFNSENEAKSYASDSPDGYMSAVDEVVEAQDMLSVQKREKERITNE